VPTLYLGVLGVLGVLGGQTKSQIVRLTFAPVPDPPLMAEGKNPGNP
jgi:hypothetical protein